jgi:hypothetical protein
MRSPETLQGIRDPDAVLADQLRLTATARLRRRDRDRVVVVSVLLS